MMRNILILVFSCLVAGLIGFAFHIWMQNRPMPFSVLEVGEQASDFSFEALDGDHYTLYDFKGKKVFVHFWATWCPPCIVEFPGLVAMARKNKDFIVLAVSSDQKKEIVQRFLANHAPDLPDNMVIIQDQAKHLAENMFGTFQLPETYILNTDLVLEEKIIGAYADWETFKDK